MSYTTIDRSSNYFRTKLYTGTGSSTSITFDESANMQPDLVWIKSRSNAYNNMLFDVLRGAGTSLFSNSTTGDEVNSPTSTTSFNSNGFSLGTNIQVNNSGSTFVNWSWKANGTGVSNTQGSISSTVSANTTSGFSIVSFTASSNGTVGHGLGAIPKMMIFKNRNLADYNWIVYHGAFSSPQSDFVYLNTTNAKSTISNYWTSSAPTSSVFSVGSTGSYYNSGNMIAYCFAEVKGFSKAFSYTGNGSTDGSYVHLGFRPAYVIIKCSSNSGDGWFVFDNKRTTYNVMSTFLLANSSASDETNTNRNIDFLSNGIKLRNSDTSLNYSGYTYVGFAIAEQPFVSSKGIVANAR